MDSLVYIKAACECILLKLRHQHPEGKFDKQGRWYPEVSYSCCDIIRSPSKSYPYSLLTHCRSTVHVANRYNIDSLTLRGYMGKKKLLLLLGMDSNVDNYVSKKLAGGNFRASEN